MKTNETRATHGTRRRRRTKQTLRAPRHVMYRMNEEMELQGGAQGGDSVSAVAMQQNLVVRPGIAPLRSLEQDTPKETRHSDDPPQIKELVWVTVGKTEHQAWLLEDYKGKDYALIRWESTRGKEFVPALAIRHMAPSNGKRRRTRAQTQRNGVFSPVNYCEPKLPRLKRKKRKVIDEPLFDDDIDQDELSFGASSSSSVPSLSSTKSDPRVNSKSPSVKALQNTQPMQTTKKMQRKKALDLSQSRPMEFPPEPLQPGKCGDPGLYRKLTIHVPSSTILSVNARSRLGSIPVKKRRVVDARSTPPMGDLLRDPLPPVITQDISPLSSGHRHPCQKMIRQEPSVNSSEPSTSPSPTDIHQGITDSRNQKTTNRKKKKKKVARARLGLDQTDFGAVPNHYHSCLDRPNILQISDPSERFMSLPIPRKAAPSVASS